mgnify:CR=1 FL=1
MTTPETCPNCGQEYKRRIGLSSRTGKRIDVSDDEALCQVAEKRDSGGPVAGHKSTRSDSERYKFIGYVH